MTPADNLALNLSASACRWYGLAAGNDPGRSFEPPVSGTPAAPCDSSGVLTEPGARFAPLLINGNTLSDVDLSPINPGGVTYQGAGVVWSSPVQVGQLHFVNGQASGNAGFFNDNNLVVQGMSCTPSACEWIDLPGWALITPYPYDASASGQAYVFSGPQTVLGGIRVVGRMQVPQPANPGARISELMLLGMSLPTPTPTATMTATPTASSTATPTSTSTATPPATMTPAATPTTCRPNCRVVLPLVSKPTPAPLEENENGAGNDNQATAHGPLLDAVTYSGKLDDTNDWYYVVLTSTTHLQIVLDIQPSTETSAPRVQLILRDGSKNLLNNGGASSYQELDTRALGAPLSAGSYYIRIFNDTPVLNRNYTLRYAKTFFAE